MSKKIDWNQLYKKIILEKINSKKWNSKGKIFPSSSGVLCELKLRFGFLGIEEKKSYVHHGLENKIGDQIHNEIQTAFKLKFGDKVEIEKYITLELEGLRINGKVDILLSDKLIIEIKTVKDDEGKEPDPAHIKQVQWYLGVLGLEHAVISYFNRSNGTHIKTFDIKYDEKIFKLIVEKFERVIKGVQNLRSDTRECLYCPFSWTCPAYKRPQWKKKNDSEE